MIFVASHEDVFKRGERTRPRVLFDAPRVEPLERDNFQKVNILPSANAGALKTPKLKSNRSMFITRSVSDAKARRTAPEGGCAPQQLE